MSWIWNPDGDAPKPPAEMVQDPSNPNRKVSTKAANQPFLAYVVLSHRLANSDLLFIVISNIERDKNRSIKHGLNESASAMRNSPKEKKSVLRKRILLQSKKWAFLGSSSSSYTCSSLFSSRASSSPVASFGSTMESGRS